MKLEIEDTVGYSRAFLKCIKLEATNESWRITGKVTEVLGKFVRVKWTTGETRLVLAENLAKPGE